MKGTEKKHQLKCCALEGRVGERVRCTIYENRPSTCRHFEASFENGAPNPRCDQARAAHGLAPLSGADWRGHGPTQGPRKSPCPADDVGEDFALGLPDPAPLG